jgi:gliding motility-associated lipoprotein GldJ
MSQIEMIFLKKYFKPTFFFVVVLLFIKCGNVSQNVSPSTGWKVNDKKGGFTYNTKYTKQETAPGMVFIEGGTFVRGKIQDDEMREWVNVPSRQHVQSFYLDETEVTNFMYTEYLFWIKKVFPPSELKYSNIYNGVVPDTLVWRNRLGFSEAMTNNYLRYPAYADYPVVGVNWIQATEFAKWRTNRYNETILEKEGFIKRDAPLKDVNAETTFDTETYLASPTSVYNGDQTITQGGVFTKKLIKSGRKTNMYVQRKHGILSIEYRLPTESEWEYAAAGDVGNRYANNQLGQKKYPWKGSYTRTDKRKKKGDQLANFKQTKGDYGGIAGWDDDGADITNKVKAYEANDFGLYDMAGNVAEWVADVYRPITDDEVSDFNYFRGNVYLKNKFNPNGKFDVATLESMQYDTLETGKLIARNFPGQIQKIPIDENETYLRTNFDKSYSVNYRDGDKESSRFFKGSPQKTKMQLEKERMYNSPINKVLIDSLGKIKKERDKTNKRNSLISDKVRVYKGGSWNDRAYWLDPAQRRFLNEEKATDFIGFRCAMTRIGSKADHKKVLRGYKITKYSKKYKSQL